MTAQQLRKSILQMAVQGKLVPQDPSDEPAHVLLERIRAEKERLIKEKKIKKEKNPSVIYRGTDNLHYEKFADGTVKCIKDEIPFEIPESWAWCRLGMVSTYADSKKKIKSEDIDSNSWVLDLEDIEKGGELRERKIAKEKIIIGDRMSFEEGNILYSKLRPYLLKILVAPSDGLCSSEIVPFSLYGGIIPEYIVAVLKCPYADAIINSVTYGVKMPRVSTGTMSSLLVPLPSINEQQKIVSRLNEVAYNISQYGTIYQQAEELVTGFPQHLRKSILQYAVQGKLVPQNESDEPASVLLERIRGEKEELIKQGKLKKDKHESVIFRRDNSYYERLDGVERCIDDEIPFEIPQSWLWVRLGSITAITGGKRIPVGSKLTSKNTGHIYIRISDMCEESISTRNLLYVPIDIYPNISKYIIRKEDVYITVAGTIGRIGKIPKQLDGANLTENADRLRLFLIEQNWLIKILQSPFIQKTIIEATTKVGQPKLAIAKIERFLIPLAPVSEQKRMFEKIKQIENFVQNL